MWRNLLSKHWMLFLVVTVGLGLAGGGYAAWTASLHVEGTVQTGNVDAVWDQQEDNEFIGVLNPATGQMEERPIPLDKDFADCSSDLQPGQAVRLVTFTVTGAFPSYTCEIVLGALIVGSVPVHITKLERMAQDEQGNDVLDTALDVDVRLMRKVGDEASETGFRCDPEQPLGLASQLHSGDRFCAIVRLHANQEAQQGQTYTAAVWIELTQWNLARPQVPPSTVALDTTLSPTMSEVPSLDGETPRPLATMTDSSGIQSDFVENEVVVFTSEQGELNAFLARWQGTVLLSTDFGAAGIGGVPAMHLVRINSSLADPSTLPDDLHTSDPTSRSDLRVSSNTGLMTLAAAARENAGGTPAGLNWVLYGDVLRDEDSIEAASGFTGPDGINYGSDAFNWPYMNRGGILDIGVAEAWRSLEVTGRFVNRVNVLVVDGGFSPNADFPVGTNVLPAGSAGTPNPSTCTGGVACPFHGTDVVMTGVGVPDNNFGVAGPGGPVTNLITLHTDGSDFASVITTAVAAINALATGPDIINMSSSGRVPAGACLFICGALDLIGIGFRAAGTLIFASAGNINYDVDTEDCFLGICWEEAAIIPCEIADVICVGGIGWNSRNKAAASSFGSDAGDCCTVDIFAPFTLWSGPTPANPGGVRLTNGTSFSSPFTAGVAALIWAADPSLSANQVEQLMLSNAHPSTDGNVRRYVNALGAVRQALGGNLPPRLILISPDDGSSHFRGAQIVFQASASDEEDGLITSSTVWTSSRDGQVGMGGFFTKNDLSIGEHVITATITDSGGFSDSESVIINVLNAPPVVNIVQPLDGANFFQSQDITLQGTSFDQDNLPSQTLADTLVAWHIDGSPAVFAIGHNAVIPGGTLSVGAHTITFIGDDGVTTPGTDTHTVNILPDPAGGGDAPVATILSPDDGDTFTGCNFANHPTLGFGFSLPVTLQGQANDTEDGALSGGSLVWSTNIEGVIGIGAVLNADIFVQSGGTNHVQVTLTATDSDGNTDTFTIEIILEIDLASCV